MHVSRGAETRMVSGAYDSGVRYCRSSQASIPGGQVRPYSDRLRHLLNALDGTYLHCDKRLSDAGPTDTIWFDEERRKHVELFLHQETSEPLNRVLDLTAKRIDGFESPLGMELLATVDWLIQREHAEPTLAGIRSALRRWSAGEAAADRKLRLFNDRLLQLALDRLETDVASPHPIP
jgi:phytoene dehydrogenase-like protein